MLRHRAPAHVTIVSLSNCLLNATTPYRRVWSDNLEGVVPLQHWRRVTQIMAATISSRCNDTASVQACLHALQGTLKGTLHTESLTVLGFLRIVGFGDNGAEAAARDGEEGAGGAEEGGGEEDCSAEFKPVVQLEEVEVQVGDVMPCLLGRGAPNTITSGSADRAGGCCWLPAIWE